MGTHIGDMNSAGAQRVSPIGACVWARRIRSSRYAASWVYGRYGYGVYRYGNRALFEFLVLWAALLCECDKIEARTEFETKYESTYKVL